MDLRAASRIVESWPIDGIHFSLNQSPAPVLLAWKNNPDPVEGCTGWGARRELDPRMFASLDQPTFIRVVGNELRGLAREVEDAETDWKSSNA